MIKDEFTSLVKKLGRQRVWQLRKERDGLCVICGKKIFKKMRCKEHYFYNKKAAFKNSRTKAGIPLDWPKHKHFNK